MTDLVETAQTLIDRRLEDEITAARKHLALSPKATGECLFCGEPQKEEGRRFCDRECASNAERHGTIDGGFIPVSDNTRIQRGNMPRYLLK